jgi:hypothetical protein
MVYGNGWITTQKYGASAEELKQILGLSSYETAWTWLHKIRKAMIRSERTKLTGIVEVDETYIGAEEHSASTGRGTSMSGQKRWLIFSIKQTKRSKNL